MKKYIQPEINVMEMELESLLCESSIRGSETPTVGPTLAPSRPRFSIWDSEDDVEE